MNFRLEILYFITADLVTPNFNNSQNLFLPIFLLFLFSMKLLSLISVFLFYNYLFD